MNSYATRITGLDRKASLFGLSTPILTDFFHRTIGPTETVIHCVNWQVDASMFPASTDLTIFADTLTFAGTVSLPGKKVFIHAREIAGVGAIDVNGVDQIGFAPGPPSSISVNYGAKGPKGDDGPKGGDAGSITILAGAISGSIAISASGGKGGRGQDGGNGVVGGPGSNGANDACGNGSQPGGPGGKGGDGGDGGAGGSGGAAGTLVVSILERGVPLPSVAIGGAPGVPGNPGQPVAGGPGGIGGITGHEGPGEGHPRPFFDGCRANGRLPNGAQGPPGNPGSVGAVGANGTSIYQTPQGFDYGQVYEVIPSNQLATQASLTQLLMVLHFAELNYLGSVLVGLSNRLGWLSTMSSATAEPQRDNAPVEMAALHDRVIALIYQLNLGLDYFGSAPNYVTLVAAAVYAGRVEHWLKAADQIQTAYNSYFQAATSLDAQRAGLASALDICKSAISDLQSQETDILTQLTSTQASVEGLTETLVALENPISSVSQQFVQDVQTSTGCSIADVFLCVGALIGIGSAAVAAVGELSSVAAGLAVGLQGLKNAVKSVKAIGSDLNDIKGSFNALRQEIVRNETKLALDETGFEKTISPFLFLNSAQSLQQLLQTYFEAVRARNQQLLNFSSLVVKQETLRTTIAQKTLEQQRIRDQYAASGDPTVAACSNFMATLLSEVKKSLYYFLYQENAALNYWTLQNKALPVTGDTDVVQLRSTHENIQDRIVTELQLRNGDTLAFQAPLLFRASDYPVEFNIFRKTGKFTFHIPLTDKGFQKLFPNYCEVTVLNVTLLVEGVRGQGDVLTTIKHCGVSDFLTTQGSRMTFYHDPRPTTYNYPIADPQHPYTTSTSNLGAQNGNFAYLSPFATWIVSIDNFGNAGPDLSRVNALQLVFNGFHLPVSIATAKSDANNLFRFEAKFSKSDDGETASA